MLVVLVLIYASSVFVFLFVLVLSRAYASGRPAQPARAGGQHADGPAGGQREAVRRAANLPPKGTVSEKSEVMFSLFFLRAIGKRKP